MLLQTLLHPHLALGAVVANVVVVVAVVVVVDVDGGVVVVKSLLY